MKGHIVTVELLIVSDTLPEAHDAVSNILSGYEMAGGTLKDWTYIRGERPNAALPIEIQEDYREGDFLDA